MYQKPAAGLANSAGFVLTDIVPYDRLNVPDPITVGIDAIGMRWLAPLIKLGVILRLTSVILLGQSRVFYAMAPGPGVRQVLAFAQRSRRLQQLGQCHHPDRAWQLADCAMQGAEK